MSSEKRELCQRGRSQAAKTRAVANAAAFAAAKRELCGSATALQLTAKNAVPPHNNRGSIGRHTSGPRRPESPGRPSSATNAAAHPTTRGQFHPENARSHPRRGAPQRRGDRAGRAGPDERRGHRRAIRKSRKRARQSVRGARSVGDEPRRRRGRRGDRTTKDQSRRALGAGSERTDGLRPRRHVFARRRPQEGRPPPVGTWQRVLMYRAPHSITRKVKSTTRTQGREGRQAPAHESNCRPRLTGRFVAQASARSSS